MAVTFVNSAVPAGNPTTSFTVTMPTVLDGDFAVLSVTSRDSTSASADVTCTDSESGFWSSINSSDKKAWIFFRQLAASASGITVTVGSCVGSSSGVLKVFRGAHFAWDAFAEQNAAADESAAAVTPTYPDSMICMSIHNYGNDNAVTNLSYATQGALSGVEKLSTGGNDCATRLGHVVQVGGPSDTGTLTWTQTDGATWTMGLSLVPPTILDAGAPVVTFSAPAVAVTTEVTVTAGAPVVVFSAPAATLQAEGGGTTLEVTAPVVTFSAPAATAVASTTLTAGAPTVTFSAPAAGIQTDGSPQTLAAGAPLVTFSAPSTTVTTEVTLTAGAPTVVFSAPAATLFAEGGVVDPVKHIRPIYPAYNIAIAVIPSDIQPLIRATDAIHVGGKGDLAVVMDGGTTVLFAGVEEEGILPIKVRQVNATGTTATHINALYRQ